jgi:hypothetical protein
MSDCGVCVGGNYDFETTGYRCVIVHARQEWECIECGCKIPKATRYELASGFTEGSHWNSKTCLICAEIAAAFCCNGRTHGNFWEDFDGAEAFSKLTTGCFSNLQTPEAKAELQRRWIAWKFEQ